MEEQMVLTNGRDISLKSKVGWLTCSIRFQNSKTRIIEYGICADVDKYANGIKKSTQKQTNA